MIRLDWKNVGLPVLLLAIAVGGYVAGAYLSSATPPTTAQKDAAAERALQKGNTKLAYQSFSARAASGDAVAQYWLGDLYLHGLGVAKDPASAVKWLAAAAAGGIVPAERQLGEIYLNGDLVLQDFAKARKWLGAAATAGDPVAQLRLGDMYVEGLGAQADPITGYAWYELSALGGDNYAQIKRDKLLATLNPAQQIEAEKAARQLSSQVHQFASANPSRGQKTAPAAKQPTPEAAPSVPGAPVAAVN